MEGGQGAVGYNVRWGIKPDRLTETYQLFAEDDDTQFGGRQHGNQLDLRALNTGVGYYVAVEAFNEKRRVEAEQNDQTALILRARPDGC